jgi:hypothetical protein
MTMNAKHTPGPWTILEEHSGCKDIGRQGRKDGSDPFDDGWEEVCYTVGHYQEDVDMANARLIASAPDWIDPVDELFRYVDRFGLPVRWEDVANQVGGFVEPYRNDEMVMVPIPAKVLRQLRNTIAKATGEP